MTLILELPDRKEAALKARAQARGVSAEEYASHVLDHDLEDEDGPNEDKRDMRPISQVIAEIMADTPSEELAKLPKDGASEHDHYLYGWPKRNH
jgi:plasmid stability protein